MYVDKTLECKDCGSEFVFTSGEQEFYAEKGFTNEPTRCKTCRTSRKQSNNRSAAGNRRPKEMHTVTCSECGSPAQVPFKPTAGKPVLCSNCFQPKNTKNRSYAY